MGETMSNKAVYPGTFDPITLGHEDLVRRAARLFDHVVLAVADSRTKKPMFTLAERIEMAREALKDVRNVTVKGFSGLLMQFATEQEARIVLRGVRAVSDFDYEFQLAGMNRKMHPEVETVFLTPGEEYMFLSATLVREISVMHGDVSKFVSPAVAGRLKAKIKELGGK
jgi:pantetheine-phosphate adenylyltransferase